MNIYTHISISILISHASYIRLFHVCRLHRCMGRDVQVCRELLAVNAGKKKQLKRRIHGLRYPAFLKVNLKTARLLTTSFWIWSQHDLNMNIQLLSHHSIITYVYLQQNDTKIARGFICHVLEEGTTQIIATNLGKHDELQCYVW